MSAFWARHAWVGGGIVDRVRIECSAGRITGITAGADAAAGDHELPGVVYPGAVNAHSHAFHRLLRGRTHGDGGSFWTWRDLMYREAGRLTPESYERIATAVYAEKVAAGWTSVAEFHYVHHRPGGEPYDEPHAMELALARAARAAGIRLTLLDTCYLSSGFGAPLAPEQERFGDGTAERWLDRLAALRARFAAEFAPDEVSVGAALHSVRAVPVDALATIAARIGTLDGPDGPGAAAGDAGLPAMPLHIHLSEQPAENEACLAATGRTPTDLLHEHGLLGPRLSAVHATHLTAGDIDLLGSARATIVMCPTTEADLGDGIGPARRLADAGANLSLGSDQHVMLDPLAEARALEHGERLASGERGRFSPAELVRAMTAGGAASTGRDVGEIRVGALCDLIAIDPASVRTAGSDPAQLVMSAFAADVREVVIGGRSRVSEGVHRELGGLADIAADLVAASSAN
ncbi:MAG: formimidoylglutamate deiminase [Leucobacter sp.]|nr:formimidoylglutamate deiminase [Leucobacter sp.]